MKNKAYDFTKIAYFIFFKDKLYVLNTHFYQGFLFTLLRLIWSRFTCGLISSYTTWLVLYTGETGE